MRLVLDIKMPARLRAIRAMVAFLLTAWCFDWPTTGAGPGPIVFENIIDSSGVRFVMDNSASARKHQIETMVSGVAIFDYNNDGLMDLYFVNGARLPDMGSRCQSIESPKLRLRSPSRSNRPSQIRLACSTNSLSASGHLCRSSASVPTRSSNAAKNFGSFLLWKWSRNSVAEDSSRPPHRSGSSKPSRI